MISKIKFYLSKDNPRLEFVSDIVFLVYLAWVTIPFISVRIPFLFNLTSGGSIAIVYRAIGSLLFAGFFIAVMIVNRLKINKIYLISSAVLIFANLLGTLILPSSVIYGDGTIYSDGYISNNNYFHISEYSVGFVSIVKGLFRLSFGLVFGYIILFVFSKISGEKIIYKTSLAYVALLIFSCFMSLVLESGNFKTNPFLNLNLRSIFASKNDFGSFLVVGLLSCIFLIRKKIKFYKYFYIPLSIFSLFSIICGCKTSLLFSIIVLLYIIFSSVNKIEPLNKNAYKVIKIVLVVTTASAFLFFLLLVSGAFPSLSSLQSNIDFVLTHEVSYTMITRVQIWSLSFKNTSFYKVLFGQTWSYGPQYLRASTSFYIGTGFSSYHNSLICMYSLSGILGLAFYLLLLVKNIKISFYAQKNKNLAFFLLIILGLLLFSFVEDDLVFVSGSGFSLYYSLMLSPVGKKIRVTKENFMELRI